MHYPCARLFPALAIRSLPVPTDPASARESSLAHMPQSPRTRFSLTLPSRYAFLSSAYPFSACPNRQPFVLGLRKGTPTYFLFPHFLIIAHVVVSCNLRHLANELAVRRFQAVNLRQGYGLSLSIRQPEEVIFYED